MVVAVNPGSLQSHSKWAENAGFQMPICVDVDKKVASAYGSLKAEGGIQRSVTVIDKKGRVAWVQEGLPDTSDILAAIDAIEG